MRKIDPNGIWADFKAQLDEQRQYYSDSWLILTTSEQQRIASENYALAIGVMLEGFINDLIFAYANRDCAKVMTHLENSVQECLRLNSKAEAAYQRFGDFKRKNHLSRDELRTILDPEGRNTSFPDYAAIQSRVDQWLADEHRQPFLSLNAKQKAVLNAVIAIRNNLAHRSKSSLDRLNNTLRAGPLHGSGLQINVKSVQRVGIYLKACPTGNETRADIIGDMLAEAAEKLIV